MRFAFVPALVVATSGAAVPAVPPTGLEARLQRAVEKASSAFNCSVSFTLKTAEWELSVATGTVDFSTGRKATPADEYAWGSVTKLLTGSNILKLVSEGAFGLEDKVMPYVDPFLKKMAKADPTQGFSSMADLWGTENISGTTFHELLHMTSGVPDFDTANPCYPQPCEAKDSLRAALYKTPSKGMTPIELMKVPWVKHHWKKCVATWQPVPFCYSSTNFMLLGLVLAAHSKSTSWKTYDQTASLPPSLRGKVQFALSGAPSKYTGVHGYDRTSYNAPSGQHANHDNYDVSGVFSGWTASDFVSNVSTVANLAWEILGPPAAVAPTKYAKMMNPGKYFYGLATQNLGSNTGRKDEYGEVYGHMGATYGYQGLAGWAPALNVSVAVATNIETDDQQQPAMAFCLGYNEALAALLGKKTSCTYNTTGGYYGGGCKCTPLVDDDSTATRDTAIVV
jgi:CubicO group peptidase (beta-lactamase class C family)